MKRLWNVQTAFSPSYLHIVSKNIFKRYIWQASLLPKQKERRFFLRLLLYFCWLLELSNLCKWCAACLYVYENMSSWRKICLFFFVLLILLLLLMFAWLNNAPQAVANYNSKSVKFGAFHLGDRYILFYIQQIRRSCVHLPGDICVTPKIFI